MVTGWFSRSVQNLKDKYGRVIEYVRLSITDRCNLRCFYCTSHRYYRTLKHSDILTYEEILTVLSILVELGIKKVRITGGEPFVRKDISILLKQIKKIPGIERLTITTNGTLLKNFIEILEEAQVDGINISLDTLREEKFHSITGRPRLRDVITGIEMVKNANIPLKINTVYSKYNIDEVENLVKFAVELSLPLRFIELMPFDKSWEENYIPEEQLYKKLEAIGEIIPLRASIGDGPARYFIMKTPWGEGKIGLISALSHKFCAECNRIRISADGKLIPCIASDFKLDLKETLRSNKSDKLIELRDLIVDAVYNKPLEHKMEHLPPPNNMRKLGG